MGTLLAEVSDASRWIRLPSLSVNLSSNPDNGMPTWPIGYLNWYLNSVTWYGPGVLLTAY